MRDLLQLSEIIDKEGAILKPEKLSDLIKLDEPQEKLLDLLLDCPINFPFEKESASFPLRKLLEHLYNRHEKEIQSITVKGGFTRRFLLSKPFLSLMLEEIGLDKEKIDLLLKEELLQSVEGPLADIDISFQLREGARPEELTQAVRESVQSGLLKFCLISDESSNFSIASFEKLDISSLCNFSANFPKSSSDSKKEYTNIEILAVRKSRDYLFPIPFFGSNFPKLSKWIDQEIESLFSSDVLNQHYEVLETYFFLSTTYLTELFNPHFDRVRRIVKYLDEKGFYEDKPEKLMKARFFKGEFDQEVRPEILLSVIKSILANRSKKALNWAFETLERYQVRMKGDNELFSLKECYQRVFELAKSFPSSTMFLNRLDESDSSIIVAIWYVFRSTRRSMLYQYSSRNILPFSNNPILNLPLRIANRSVNGFQFLKDKYVGAIASFCKIEYFSPKKEALEFMREFSVQFFSFCFQNKDCVFEHYKKDTSSFLIWLMECAISCRNQSAFIGKEGHKRYYAIVGKILNYLFECSHKSRDENMLEKLYDLVAGREDKNTDLFLCSKDQALCETFAQDIVEKRKNMLDLIFKKVLGDEELFYRASVNRLYRKAQEAGIYGIHRQKKPKAFQKIKN